jgi:hypothetical protein
MMKYFFSEAVKIVEGRGLFFGGKDQEYCALIIFVMSHNAFLTEDTSPEQQILTVWCKPGWGKNLQKLTFYEHCPKGS